MDRVKVAVVVGHRSKRQGAIGSAGISEWLYNKKLAKEIKEYFKDSIKRTSKCPNGWNAKCLIWKLKDWIAV